MFTIYDGRSKFYQWDLDQKLIISDPTINEVHFCNQTGDCALVCVVYEEEDQRLVNVPNILLQDIWPIKAYAHCDCATITAHVFEVLARSKPADYAYTETEVRTWENLNERVNNLELGNCAITDVEVLPTEGILPRLLYRTPEGVYWFADGWHRIVDEEEFNSLLTAETERAIEAEKNNAATIAEETERAKTAEQINTKSISDEVDRATARENEIEESLETHKATYDAKVSEIEEFNIADAENLAHHISAYNEKVACLDKADTANAEAIANEAKRANEAEIALANRLTDEVARQDNDIADATATANEAKKTADTLDNTIQNALTHSIETREQLNEEIERAIQAENANAKAISNEEIRAKAEEQKNAIAIVTEETRAKKTETDISNALNAHKTAYDNKVAELEAFNAQDAQNLATHISAYIQKTRELEVADQALADALADALAELNALLASDDATLNELQEIVDYIKNNKNLIDAITINKVNVADIVDHLLSLETVKPLSANQGRVLKDLIDNFKTTYDNKVGELERIDTVNENAIIAEKSRAELAEKANADAIKAEETRADTAEKALGVRIDTAQRTAELAAADATETLNVANAAKTLAEQTQNTLNQEIQRATGTHQAFTDALEAHKTAYNEKVALIDAGMSTDAQNLATHLGNYDEKMGELDAKDSTHDKDIEELKINKQDNLSFEGTYSADANKVATVSTVTNALSAEKGRAEAEEAKAVKKVTYSEPPKGQPEQDVYTPQYATSTKDVGYCARAYARGRDDTEVSILVSKWDEPNTMVIRNEHGRFLSQDLVDNSGGKEVANKNYVDGKITATNKNVSTNTANIANNTSNIAKNKTAIEKETERAKKAEEANAQSIINAQRLHFEAPVKEYYQDEYPVFKHFGLASEDVNEHINLNDGYFTVKYTVLKQPFSYSGEEIVSEEIKTYKMSEVDISHWSNPDDIYDGTSYTIPAYNYIHQGEYRDFKSVDAVIGSPYYSGYNFSSGGLRLGKTRYEVEHWGEEAFYYYDSEILSLTYPLDVPHLSQYLSILNTPGVKFNCKRLSPYESFEIKPGMLAIIHPYTDKGTYIKHVLNGAGNIETETILTKAELNIVFASDRIKWANGNEVINENGAYYRLSMTYLKNYTAKSMQDLYDVRYGNVTFTNDSYNEDTGNAYVYYLERG